MDGILNILKPAGVTSFDVVQKVRRLLKIKKVGHTGTLDPDAVGVLPICLGKATRMVEYLVNDHKIYRAELTLGITTDTQDAKGKVIASSEVSTIDQENLHVVLHGFLGKITQIPPMVSAVKYQGRRLYELARAGVEVQRQAREIEIFNLELLKIDFPRFWLDVECSKGTYIRTLADDIGKALGCGAHLSYLIRTGTGTFSLENSLTLDEIAKAQENGNIKDLLLPIDWGIQYLPKIVIKDNASNKAFNGARLLINDLKDYPNDIFPDQLFRVYLGEKFILIAKLVNDQQVLQPVKVFA